MVSRYDEAGTEGEFEPGSDGRVLKNLCGITSSETMDDAEAFALEQTMLALVKEFDENHQFSAEDICRMHRLWLGNIYEWAGSYRRVNVSKDGFMFAVANQVEPLMAEFERDLLSCYTPCNFDRHEEVVRALAKVHVELVLIHPFREGNGRAARMLSSLMALQAGLPLLDFSLIAEARKSDYFSAIQQGLDNDYRLMERLFFEIIEQSLPSA